jgi:hypothetical protein
MRIVKEQGRKTGELTILTTARGEVEERQLWMRICAVRSSN